MAAEGFEGEKFGRLYETLMESVITPAWSTLLKWLTSGEMSARCRNEGRPVRRRREKPLTAQERSDLAVDAVLAGEELFLRVGLRGGGWKPDGGRNLFSYFVTACIREFAQVYTKWEEQQIEAEERWVRESRGGEDGKEDTDILDEQPCPAPGPEAMAVLQDESERALALMPEELRKIMRYRRDGLTQREAAARVGVPPSATQARLGAWRSRHVRPDPGDGLYGKEIY